MTRSPMARAFLALLAALVALAGPVAGQDADEGDPSGTSADPSAEPSADTTETTAEPSSGGSTDAANPASACQVVAIDVFDPKVSYTSWVRPDPDGCIRYTVYRLLGWPPAVTTLP